MASINPLIALCSVWPILFVSAFAHELGHAVVGHAVGFAVTSFGLGVARPYVSFLFGHARIYLGRTKPLQGIAFCVPPHLIPARRQMIPFLAHLPVYRAAADLRAQNGDWLGAEVAYRRAIAAIDELARSWHDAEELRGFLERQSPFFDEVRRCYNRLNRAEEADMLLGPLLSAEQIEQTRDDDLRRRLLRLRRAGRWALLFDVSCSFAVIISWASVRTDPSHPLAGGGILFILCTFVAIVFWVLYSLVALVIPRLRSSGALVTATLAFFPWLALLTLLMASLVMN